MRCKNVYLGDWFPPKNNDEFNFINKQNKREQGNNKMFQKMY